MPHGHTSAGPHAVGADPQAVRALAVAAAAQFHGVDLDPDALRHAPGEVLPARELVAWARSGGLEARAVRLDWRRLMKLRQAGPAVLLLENGGAALLMRTDRPRNIIWLRDPAVVREQDGVPVDELRLRQVWAGETLLISRRANAAAAPRLGMGFLIRLVMAERGLMRDVLIGSLVLSFLAILPALAVMVVLDRVLTYHNISTLNAIAALLVLALIWETLLGFARRRLINIVGTRVDVKLNNLVFSRVLGLPLDFFERRQTGAIMFQVNQIQKIREFLTGKMLATILDLVTILVMLPLLFYLDATLTWIIIAAGGLCSAVILAFLGPVRTAHGRWIGAEMERSTVMLETVHGMRTVKSLALERQQRDLFDKVTAESADAKEKLGYVGNWPQTLATLLEAMMTRGVLMIGAWMALAEGRGNLGVLLAFMMLGGRLAQPLANLARLIEDLEEVRGAIVLASDVVDQRQEAAGPGVGARPEISGAIRFDKVDFGYPGTRMLALESVSFFIPAGSTVGLVGRSGSGKSTVTRLLQGFATGYEGAIEIDGHEIRAINLEYLRSQFGVVLQDNFLFRGSIRDNIIAGRPGLTLADAVRAARLGGAEEFIERLPEGYETVVEEGSPNLSGGQKQRLAIARALIHDPRILILDEATSALDPESEAVVNANIARIAHGRTMVVVSHRLSSLTEMDQIVVLDRGKVMDVGPHRDLVERCPVYRQPLAAADPLHGKPARRRAGARAGARALRGALTDEQASRRARQRQAGGGETRRAQPRAGAARRGGGAGAAGIPVADGGADRASGAAGFALRHLGDRGDVHGPAGGGDAAADRPGGDRLGQGGLGERQPDGAAAGSGADPGDPREGRQSGACRRRAGRARPDLRAGRCRLAGAAGGEPAGRGGPADRRAAGPALPVGRQCGGAVAGAVLCAAPCRAPLQDRQLRAEDRGGAGEGGAGALGRGLAHRAPEARRRGGGEAARAGTSAGRQPAQPAAGDRHADGHRGAAGGGEVAAWWRRCASATSRWPIATAMPSRWRARPRRC